MSYCHISIFVTSIGETIDSDNDWVSHHTVQYNYVQEHDDVMI